MQATFAVGEYRAGEAAFMCRGSTTKLDATRRGLVYAHGGGGSAIGDFPSPTYDLLTSCGYPCHAGDYCASTYWTGGGWNWGNSDHSAAIDAGWTALKTAGAKTDKVCLFGASMGALGCLNYYKAHPTNVQAMALFIPVLDINDVASNDKGFIGSASGSFVAASMYTQTLPQATITLAVTVASAGIIAGGPPGTGGTANTVNILTTNGMQKVTFTAISGSTLTGCTGGTGTLSAASTVSQGYGPTLVNAYGVTWPTQFSGAQLTANSPIVWAEVAGALTVPTRIWSSDNDYVASNTAVCTAWATAVAAAGGGNVTPTVTSLGSVGHTTGSFNPSDIVAFFDANGGRS